MKADPQNSGLQQQLHELQSQITSLSEKQKMIVQLLKKELVVKPSQANPAVVTTAQGPMPAHIKVVPQTSVVTTPALEATRTLPLLAPKPANNVNQMAAKSITITTSSNTVSHRTDNAINSQDSRLLNNNNKIPITENSSEVSQKSNATPLKVPQFHSSRPSILQNACHQSVGSIVQSPLVPVTARTVSDPELSSFKKFALHKETNPEEKQKVEFMASLELIAPEAVKEFQSRRSERKRRSTANPQFTYVNFEPEVCIYFKSISMSFFIIF